MCEDGRRNIEFGWPATWEGRGRILFLIKRESFLNLRILNWKHHALESTDIWRYKTYFK
jgi:hypothetical protein